MLYFAGAVLLAGLSLYGAGSSASAVTKSAPRVPESVSCTASGTVDLDPPLKSAAVGGESQQINVSGSGTATNCTQPGYVGTFEAQLEITKVTVWGSCEKVAGAGEGKIIWKGGPHSGETTKLKGVGTTAGLTGNAQIVAVSGPYAGNMGVPAPATDSTPPELVGDCATTGVSQVKGTGVGALEP